MHVTSALYNLSNMCQVWVVLVTLEVLAATSLGQYSGNPYLDSAIDKTWQRHGGGFMNQESYAHDASKERKISTTIGTFGTPLTSSAFLPHLRSQYDHPEYSSLYLPEVALTGNAERLIGVNYEPLRAIESSLHGPVYINKYGKNYARDGLLAVEEEDKLLYKGYSERLPHDIIYEEHPIDKDRVSVITHVHPSVQEDYVVEKFRKNPYEKDYVTVRKHNPKGEYVTVDTVYKDLPKVGQVEVKTQEKVYKDAYDPFEDFQGRDHLIVKTEEKIFKDKLEPTMDHFYADKYHKDHPERDHIMHETVYKDLKHPGTKLLEREHVVLSSQDKLYRDESDPQEYLLLDRPYKDPYRRDSIALTAHEKTYKDVYDPSDPDSHHHISVKTEEIYQPKVGAFDKDHLTVKTQEKIYKDGPKPGADKITVEHIYRTHSLGKPELYEEPYFGYEKEYSDDKFDFEDADERILRDRELYRVNEKQVKMNVPVEESIRTFRTRPTYRNSWPRKKIPCDDFMDSSEC